jgi:hypothetical protein
MGTTIVHTYSWIAAVALQHPARNVRLAVQMKSVMAWRICGICSTGVVIACFHEATTMPAHQRVQARSAPTCGASQQNEYVCRNGSAAYHRPNIGTELDARGK